MPPIGSYFGGHGTAVKADMVRRHGEKAGTRAFYATANKRGQKPDGEHADDHKRPFSRLQPPGRKG